MIRVLQVVTDMNRGGIETMLMNYYRHIDRDCVQFDFLIHRQDPGAYGDEIKAMGGKIYSLPKLVPWSRSYQKALNLFFDEHPEYKIIHSHQNSFNSVILKAAAQHNIPVRISHSHTANADKNIKYLIKSWYKKKIVKYATKLMACSKEAGEWLYGDAPFEIINNAIDAEQYVYNSEKRVRMRNALGVRDDELLVGHVGSFSLPKNHTFLIDIFNELQKKTSAKLLLVGKNKGKIADDITQKIANLGIADKVIFTGVRSDVADLMQAMDVFVFPSLYEGLAIVLIEAQASGLPCIVSDTVPREAYLTDCVFPLSLSVSLEGWAKKAIEESRIHRVDCFEEIALSGYDVAREAEKLQKFYIDILPKDDSEMA